MRRNAKVDDNQPMIVRALRRAGASVQSLATVGEGCTDIVVGARGENYLLEIKDPSKPKADQKLNPRQVKWHAEWKGQKAVVKDIQEALRACGLMR